MTADVQTEGNIEEKDWLKIVVTTGNIAGKIYLSILVGILSTPTASLTTEPSTFALGVKENWQRERVT